MILTYFKQVNGKIDEVMSLSNRIKLKDVQTASIILDFGDQSVLKCVVDGKSMPKDWDRIVGYYYPFYTNIMERLLQENGHKLSKEIPAKSTESL
jgi:AAA+ ATPase superfamily predicted ATPase